MSVTMDIVSRLRRPIALCACAVLLNGCAGMMRTVEVRTPLTAAPVAPPVQTRVNGSIYQSSGYQAVNYQPLFEDRRARFIGDTLVININEKLNASKKASTSTDHKGGTSFNVADAQIGGRGIKGGSISAKSDNSFAGSGDSGANNVFTGTITVTVVEVLSNGNLVVAGEKQIGINTGSEFVRLSGVVNPAFILAGNVVSSTQIADARLEYRGTGSIDEAQTQGWLSRAFNTVMPF